MKRMGMEKEISAEQIKQWLDSVKDPEIPVLSLNDLGVITGIDIGNDGKVTVNMTPTFAGCPARCTLNFRNLNNFLRRF